jgi:hypothetical protein
MPPVKSLKSLTQKQKKPIFCGMSLDDLSDFFGGEGNIDVENDVFAPPARPVHTPLSADDDLGFSPLLPVELALKTAPVEAIYTSYGLTKDDFTELMTSPAFISAYKDAQALVKEEGMAFKLKAKMQAEEMLKVSWSLVHDKEVPPSVRADLLKWTSRVAGFEPKNVEQGGPAQQPLNIQINLG